MACSHRYRNVWSAIAALIYRRIGETAQSGGAACTGCHGANASGTPLGPDLTDTQWLWGSGSYASISKTITSGVPQPKQFRSPMPPMGGAQLSSGQVSAVAAYIWGLSHRLPAAASAGRS